MGKWLANTSDLDVLPEILIRDEPGEIFTSLEAKKDLGDILTNFMRRLSWLMASIKAVQRPPHLKTLEE